MLVLTQGMRLMNEIQVNVYLIIRVTHSLVTEDRVP